MNADVAMQLLAQTLLTAAKISAPILIATLAVGVIISIFQVATQVQEATLTFVPKLLVVVIVLLLLGAWMLSTLVAFALHMVRFASGL
ncbi:MAG: flagellar biosynthetic protein FliQ [Betaproteobacteria bacterium]|nr:flagellar biosynthetic protein FliQ [Betaproteobacteria bacterium]